MGEAESAGAVARLGEHLRGHVDPADAAGGADLACGDERVEPGSRSGVNHPLTWRESPQRERVADPGEGLDGPVGQPVDDGRVIAEASGQRPPGVEVMRGVGGERDVAVKFAELKWSNEPVKSTSSSNTTTTRPATTGAGATASSGPKTYPDHAVFNATKDELKSMPEFKYAT